MFVKGLSSEKCQVIAIDSLSDYYDINLKKDRLKILKENELFLFIKGEIEKEGSSGYFHKPKT